MLMVGGGNNNGSNNNASRLAVNMPNSTSDILTP